MIATDSLQRLYDEAATHNAQPLWTMMEAVVPPHPEPKAVPHVWRWEAMRPLLERAGNLVARRTPNGACSSSSTPRSNRRTRPTRCTRACS